MLHKIKLCSKWWNDVKNGVKKFEARKNDRKYNKSDLVEFWKWDEKNNMYLSFDNKLTNIEDEVDKMTFVITYVQHGEPFSKPGFVSRFFGIPGIREGYAVFGIERVCGLASASPSQHISELDIHFNSKYQSGVIKLKNNGSVVSESSLKIGDIYPGDEKSAKNKRGSIELSNLSPEFIYKFIKAISFGGKDGN